MGKVISITRTKFSVGQLVHHRLFGYRGVVFDVDRDFQGSEEWYELMAQTRPPKNRPWYHVLVDGRDHTTYVAERNLEPDVSQEPVDHPMVVQLFSRFEDGVYFRRETVN